MFVSVLRGTFVVVCVLTRNFLHFSICQCCVRFWQLVFRNSGPLMSRISEPPMQPKAHLFSSLLMCTDTRPNPVCPTNTTHTHACLLLRASPSPRIPGRQQEPCTLCLCVYAHTLMRTVTCVCFMYVRRSGTGFLCYCVSCALKQLD